MLAPSFVGAELMLFGSAFSAFATALALDGGTLVVPAGQDQLRAVQQRAHRPGSTSRLALGTEMILVVLIVMVGYWFVQRRAGRWLR